MTIVRPTKTQREAVRAMRDKVDGGTDVQRVKRVTCGKRVELDLDSEAVRNFVESAPDGPRAQKAAKKKSEPKRSENGRWSMKGKKVVISVGLPPEMLEAFDKRAKEQARTRAQLLEMIIRRELLTQEQPVKFG